MAKLADALDLGSSAARHGGSSPLFRTTHFYQSIFKNTSLYTAVFTLLKVFILEFLLKDLLKRFKKRQKKRN